MPHRRRFGRVRRLPSGRWQARYKGPDGIDRPAPHTFPSKADAERWLTLTEAEIMRGDWINPDAGLVSFTDYARTWVAERPNLRPKTTQLYEGLVRLHLLPLLGQLAIQDITEPRVRRWRKQLLDADVGAITVAKAYRLLKAILNTAVDDGLIRRNPCRIQGAGQEKSPERPVLTLRQVFDLADAIAPRFRLLILLAVFCGLRWGELAALRRRHIDLAAGVIRVEASMAELIDGSLVIGPPKSAAGNRFVAIPAVIQPDVLIHLDLYTGADPDSFVFTGPKNAPLRRSNFTKIWRWVTAKTGLIGVHFHDLRHAGNVLAARTGAGLRELMDRMGHSTTQAALIYQHGSAERDRYIADEISKLAEAELRRSKSRTGTQRARNRKRA